MLPCLCSLRARETSAHPSGQNVPGITDTKCRPPPSDRTVSPIGRTTEPKGLTPTLLRSATPPQTNNHPSSNRPCISATDPSRRNANSKNIPKEQRHRLPPPKPKQAPKSALPRHLSNERSPARGVITINPFHALPHKHRHVRHKLQAPD